MTTDRWRYGCELDKGHAPEGGLVLTDVSHDGFHLAREIRVASIWINPDSPDPTLRRRLVLGLPDFTPDGKVEHAFTTAPPPFDLYEIEHAIQQKYVSAVIPDDPIFGEYQPALFVTQDFRFSTYGNDPPHEPVGSLPAARLFPYVTFATKNPLIQAIRIDYRIHLSFREVDVQPPNLPDRPALPRFPRPPALSQAGVFRDHDELPTGAAPTLAALQKEDELFEELLDTAAALRKQAADMDEKELILRALRALEALDALPGIPTMQPFWVETLIVVREAIRLGSFLSDALLEALANVLEAMATSWYAQSASAAAHAVQDAALSIGAVAEFVTEHLLFAAAEKPVPYEILGQGLEHGGTSTTLDGATVPTWDNIHVWPKRDELPSTPGAFHAAHMHWRWGNVAAMPEPIEVLAQKWIGIEQAGHPVLSVPAAGGPLIDAAIADQTIRFAIAEVTPKEETATTAKFDERFLTKNNTPAEIGKGAELAIWMSFHVQQQQDRPFGGTVFAQGLYFPHEPESKDNPFGFTQGIDIPQQTPTPKWFRQPKPD